MSIVGDIAEELRADLVDAEHRAARYRDEAHLLTEERDALHREVEDLRESVEIWRTRALTFRRMYAHATTESRAAALQRLAAPW